MKVELINYTQDAVRQLIMSKKTRHLDSPIDNFNSMTPDHIERELRYIIGSIGSALEFVDYTFIIKGVTRAFTHQLVRHRVGTSFAQQSQRFANLSDIGVMEPRFKRKDTMGEFRKIIDYIKSFYSTSAYIGEDIQDCRGILPVNTKTNIMFKANLKALSGIISERLCIRTQREFRNIADLMKKEVVKIHPWAAPLFLVTCAKNSVCPWKNFRNCPIKRDYPILDGLSMASQKKIDEINSNLLIKDFQPK